MIKEKLNKLFFPHDHKSEHLKSLDGLRGVAVLFVLLSHSSNANIFIHEALNFQRVGKIGVYLFFVLSAYLLDRQIALVFMSNKSSLLYWKNYFLRRFLRIYPLFVVSLILHGLLTLGGIETVIDEVADIPFHLFLMKGESIFWSIPVEFKYYFISPLIMWFCHKYLKWEVPKLLFAFLLSIIFAILVESVFHLSFISTLKYLPIFLVGTFISIYELLINKELLKRIKPSIFNAIGLVAIALIFASTPYYFERVFGFRVDFHAQLFFLPYALLWGAVLLSAKYGKGIIKRFLELKILRFIGTISFSMYLFHMLFLDMVEKINVLPYLRIYVFFLATIIFSMISFLLIERPLSKIRIYSKKTIPEVTHNKQTNHQ